MPPPKIVYLMKCTSSESIGKPSTQKYGKLPQQHLFVIMRLNFIHVVIMENIKSLEEGLTNITHIIQDVFQGLYNRNKAKITN